jgi:hypothetical protein
LGDVATLTRRTNLLLQDESLREKLGNQGQQRTQHEFSLEKMVAAHQQLYQQLRDG